MSEETRLGGSDRRSACISGVFSPRACAARLGGAGDVPRYMDDGAGDADAESVERSEDVRWRADVSVEAGRRGEDVCGTRAGRRGT